MNWMDFLRAIVPWGVPRMSPSVEVAVKEAYSAIDFARVVVAKVADDNAAQASRRVRRRR